MPHRYPPEFRRKVLDLLAARRSVASVALALGCLLRRSTTGVGKTASIEVRRARC